MQNETTFLYADTVRPDGEVYKTTAVTDFNSPLLLMARSPRQKTNKDRSELKHNYRANGPNGHLQDILPNSIEHTFFSSVYGAFSRMEKLLKHKSSLSKHFKI